MKTLFPIIAVLVLTHCTSQSSALKSESASARPIPTADKTNEKSNSSAVLDEAAEAEQSRRHNSETQNGRFKTPPDAFKNIDFENHLYPYKLPNGKKINIPSKDGEYEYDFSDDRGWFSFSDPYYVDLTNDENPEAITILGHVSCGVSCDGGAELIYIYTIRQNKLKLLWHYETGSAAYGCGLKSFTIKDRKITMELFGRCSDGEKEYEGMSKFQVKDTTRLTFGFNDRKFVEEKKEFVSVPERNVMNYMPEISINE